MGIGFRRHLGVEVIKDEGVCLISARGTVLLSGRPAETLAPLLDGSRGLAEVVRDAAPRLSPDEVRRAYGQLARAGLTRASGSGTDCAQAAFWDLAGVAPADRPAAVEVVTLGNVDRAAALRGCAASGLRATEGGAFALVLCEDYLDPRLRAINSRRLESGRPWLLARPGGPDPWVGPVFRPGSGPCWSCLAHRLHGHRRSRAFTRVRPPEASLPAGRAAGLEIAILETAKWLAGCRYSGQDAIWTLDSLTLASGHHQVTRRPQCPDCGDPGLVTARVSRPVVIAARPKPSGTGDRAATAARTLARYGHLADPVTGIVDGLRRDPHGTSAVHRFVAGSNLAVTGRTLPALRAGLRMPSGGKGMTEEDARVSALAEAVERYCGARFGDEPTVRAAFGDLGDQAVHPDACQLFADRQFAERDRWNADQPAPLRVPRPFDEHAPIDWTPVWSLTAGRHRLLPTALLYYGARSGAEYAYAHSNGNAAGASLEDAVLHGFLELVERDAVALWWYNRTCQPALDLAALDDPGIAALRRSLEHPVWALDLTSDLGIPVAAAVMALPNRTALLGFGAHFDPRMAARRALTELGQLSSADDLAVPLEPYLLPAGSPPDREPSGAATGDLREDIAGICRLVKGLGLELLVLDQTRPDVEMPVVKVLVPGLRHFWPRFAPGRLFDVPVRLGRVAAPTPYDRLNPTPLFL